MHSKFCFTNVIMVILFTFSMATFCFGQSYWKKTYQGISDYNGIQVSIQTADGNFLIVCGKIEFEEEDLWILKIKPNGDTIWTKTYGGGDNEHPISIIPTADGNFLILGETSSSDTEDCDIWLLKINPNGERIWTKTYGEKDAYAKPETIIPTADDNFLILGRSKSLSGFYDLWLLKIKPNGDIIWTKTFGAENNDFAQSITPADDNNFLISGTTYSSDTRFYDLWLLKINSNGDTLWTKTFGGGSDDFAQSVIPTVDSGFLILGTTYSFGAGDYDFWLLKINPNGDTLWTKTFGSEFGDYAQMIIPALDGNFLISGITYPHATGDCDITLLKINPNGDTIWSKTFGGVNGEYPQTITPTIDGNFLLVGSGNNPSLPYRLLLISIIADQYAYKNSPFTFKIPTYGIDSLNFGYVPLRTPAGMTVSPGGTICWTPKTDSVYMDHIEFIIINDTGKKDTLTFNIFVNSDLHTSGVVKPFRRDKNTTKSFDVIPASSGNRVKFTSSSDVSTLCIYDGTGKLIDKIRQLKSGEFYTWPAASSKAGRLPAGKYFARASTENGVMVKPFLLVR